MQRFCGMISPSDIIIEKNYTDKNNVHVVLQANTDGWTIILKSTHGITYEDVQDTADNNFNKAYTKATEMFGPLTEHNPWWN